MGVATVRKIRVFIGLVGLKITLEGKCFGCDDRFDRLGVGLPEKGAEKSEVALLFSHFGLAI